MNPFDAAEGQAHGALFDLSGDPCFTRSIFPVVYHGLDQIFTGLGSSFCVSFEGGFVTAMHVVSDTLKEMNASAAPAGMLGIVFVPGIVYGRSITQPFRAAPNFRLFPGEPDPLALGKTAYDLSRITLDLAAFSPTFNVGEAAAPLWVRTGRAGKGQFGDELLAVGFDQIDGVSPPGAALLNYEHRLKGCVLRVHQVDVRRESRTRGGPTIILDVNLPPGFSGGPVFDRDGAVVGVVSTGNEAGNYSTLVWTELLPEEGPLFTGQDHSNPNWFVAWGVYVGDENMPRQIFWREGEAKIAAQEVPGARVSKGARPTFENDSFVRT